MVVIFQMVLCIRIFNLSDGLLLELFIGDSTDQIFERLAISPDKKFVAGDWQLSLLYRFLILQRGYWLRDWNSVPLLITLSTVAMVNF